MRTLLLCFCFCLPLFSQAFAGRLDSLLAVLEEGKLHDTLQIKAMNDIAQIYYGRDIEKMKHYAAKAYTLSQASGYAAGEFSSARILGVSYWVNGAYDSAVYFYDLAYTKALAADDKKAASGALNNTGLIYYRTGEYEKSLEIYFKALDLKEEIGATTQNVLKNMGNVYYKQENYSQAEKYYLRAKAQAEASGNSINIGDISTSLASVAYARKDYKEALTLYEDAIAQYQQGESNSRIALGKSNLASALMEMERYDEARQYLKEALVLYQKIGNKTGVITALAALAPMEIHLKAYSSAEKHAKEGLALAEEVKYKDKQRVFLNLLFELEEKRGNWKAALSYHKRYVALKDSLMGEEKAKQLAEIETRYETEKKEQENLLLQKENTLNTEKVKQQTWQLRATYIGLLFLAMALGSVGFLLQKNIASRKRLKEKNKKITEQNEQIRVKEKEVSRYARNLQVANKHITRKNANILASIHYANSIQQALLPSSEVMQQYFGDHFVLNLPRDVVSGDFYWVHEAGHKTFLAVADCTGHGVPGGFMSMLGINALSEIVTRLQIEDPAMVLSVMHENIYAALHQAHSQSRDSIEMIFMVTDAKNSELHFASARRPLWYLRPDAETQEEGLEVHKGSRVAVGDAHQRMAKYTTKTLPWREEEGVYAYAFSDGYQDQFGGANNAKFGLKRLRSLLWQQRELSLEKQGKQLSRQVTAWREAAGEEQTDDILMLGISSKGKV